LPKPLANSITMTPGTITVDIITITCTFTDLHRSEDPEVYTGMITGVFEKYIKRIVE
jgi:multisubunit Na+/H+ antiporter MnhE subunit